MRRDFPLTRPELKSPLVDQNQPDYATTVAKAMGLQRTAPAYLDPRVQVGVQLEDYAQPEFWWLRRGGLGMVGADLGAVAGQVPFLAVSAPAGTIVILEKIQITNPNAGANKYLIGMQAALPAAGSSIRGTFRDDRNGLNATAKALITQGTNAAPTSPTFPMTIYTQPVSGPVEVPGPWIVTGDAFFTIVGFTVAQVFNVQLTWRERDLLPTEQ